MPPGRGWRRGFGNLTRGVLPDWLGGRRWLTSSLVWLGLIDVILGLVLFQARATGDTSVDGIMLYCVFSGAFLAVGAVIATQQAIVGEKVAGTAAWVMSKPVSRVSFVLSKAVGNGAGLLVTAVLIPSAIAYMLLSRLGPQGWLNPAWFLAGMGIVVVNMLFWLSLSLMLGAYLGQPAGVIALPLGLLFGQQFLVGVIPALAEILPWALTSPVDPDTPAVAAQLIRGAAPASWLPVPATILASALFLFLGVRRFARQDL